jgi:hypothetical protein
MLLPSRKVLRLGLTVAGAGALVLGTAATAGASGGGASSASYTSAAAFRGHAPVIPIDVTTAGGFSLPSHVRAGFVTVKITSPESDYHAIQPFRLANGASLEDVMNDVNLALLSTSADDISRGIRQLTHDAVEIGGAVTTPLAPTYVTMAMPPGTYYFFDLADVFNGVTPRIHTIQAVGHPNWKGLPRFSQVIVTTMINDAPRFIAPTDERANGTYLVVNNSDEIHEAVWRQTRPGITDQYITDFYNSVIAGNPLQSPWVDTQHGLQGISPGQFAVIHIDYPVGQYALICYVPDDENGLPHGWEGMHQVVQLH